MSEARCEELFEAMVQSVGVKAFAMEMHLSTRQVYRVLNGVQPNPIARLCEVLEASAEAASEAALDYICQRRGGYFVRQAADLKRANVNAVKESAEAIVAISEGRSPRVTVREIREAIAALAALERLLQTEAGGQRDRHLSHGS